MKQSLNTRLGALERQQAQVRTTILDSTAPDFQQTLAAARAAGDLVFILVYDDPGSAGDEND